jgi:Flp pilus assembly protein TadG
MRSQQRTCRRAAMTVEAAIVLPVMVFLLLFLVVGGMGVFRYQQVACLAREAARYASVRGTLYEQYTDKTSPTQDEIKQAAVMPLAVGMDSAKIEVQIDWINGVTGDAVAWDSAKKSPRTLSNTNIAVTSSVRVRVNYTWSPGVLVPGSIILSSTSVMPMSF